MATVRLTDKSVASARPAESKRYELWDAVLPGFGVRVTDKGRKTWFLMFYMFGQRRRMTLGTYPGMSLADARTAARKALEDVQKGIDPAAEKITLRKTRPQTFGELATEYLERHAKPNKKTAGEDENKLNADVLPEWRQRKVDTIRRADVLRILETVSNRGAPFAANRLLALLKKMFNWALDKDLVDYSPAAHIKPLAKERSRERILSDAELLDVWQAAGQLDWPWNGFFRLLILTGQRRGEVAGMRWDEIDHDAKIWSLKADRTKADRAHDVPLSQTALNIIEGLPQIGGPFVFPAGADPEAENSISGFGKAKGRLDLLSGVSDWWIHDLRRTASSGMARMGFPPHVAEKVLNHSSGQISGVAAVYNRYGYEGEKRQALDAWANYVTGLEKPKGGNVVPFQKNPNS